MVRKPQRADLETRTIKIAGKLLGFGNTKYKILQKLCVE